MGSFVCRQMNLKFSGQKIKELKFLKAWELLYLSICLNKK